jgi:hypothetical protein
MADQLSLRGGTTAEHATFTGANKEVTVDTTKKTLVVNDGATVGGHPLMRENASNSALALGSASTPSLKWDANTGIYSPGADQLAVATNGTGRLFIDATGNVGVGLSNPSYPLEVASSTNSTINITGGTSNSCRLFFSDTALARGFLNYDHADDSINIGTAGSERLRITSAGLVGIGTSSPSELLTVVGNARLDKASSDLFIKIGGTTRGGNTYSNYIDLDNNGFGAPGAFQTASKGDKLILWGGNGPDSESRIGFSLDDAVWIKAMGATVPNAFAVHGAAANSGSPNRLFTITKSGNVGIGSATPGGKLTVVTTTDTPGNSFGGFTDSYLAVSTGTTAASSGLGFGYDSTNNHGLILSVSPSVAWRPIRYIAGDHRFEITGGIEKARIDSSGRLLVGTSTARANFLNATETAKLQIEGAVNISAVRTDDTAYPSWLILGKTRSTGNTIVQSGDIIGRVAFEGNDGSEFVDAAFISAEVDGTPGANDMPGRIVLSTTAAGAATPTERMRITSTGQVRLAGAGITFNGDTAAANELDDYEEGTFTPALGDLAGGVSTMSTQEGKYVKVGKIVQFSLQIVWTAKNTWTGANARINGLPFAATANTGSYYWPNPATMNCNLTTTAFNYAVEASTTQGYVMDLLGNQIDSSQWPSSGRVLVNGVYQAA